MNAVQVNWKFGAFEALTEDIQIPCEKQWNPHCGRSNPAEWIAWVACTCAPPYVLWCTPCKDRMLNGDRIWCRSCGDSWATAGEAFRLIEPLNRSTA